MDETLSQVRERGVILDRACASPKGSRLQLQRHEHLRRDLVLAADTEARSTREAELGVVLGMPENDDGDEAQLTALLQTRANEGGAHAFALVLRGYS